MKHNPPIGVLFAVIILEGYVVLSSELIVIRQTLPFVGSGTDSVSIIIAAVLLPLAFGYHAGGRIGLKDVKSIRRKLINNMLISACILLPGLSYVFMDLFFSALTDMGIKSRLIKITLFSTLFLSFPVYLLGQTIPLICNFFSREKLSKIAGRILFFSTLGSFLGAVFATLVLMSTIGVHYTAIVNFFILALLIFLMSKNKLNVSFGVAFLIALAAWGFNSGEVMRANDIVENNQYNTIKVLHKGDVRILSLNNNSSSAYADDGRKHHYVANAERIALSPIINSNPPKNILVIGAGAFTFGSEDGNNIYDYVDIDPSLQQISEDHILKRPLSENKTFHAVPARAYLNNTEKQYDLVFLDVFTGDITVPEHLMTQDFFRQVKSVLRDNAVVITNFLISPNFKTDYSKNIDDTFRSVFPYVSRLAPKQEYRLWDETDTNYTNMTYVYKHSAEDEERPNTIYTDNKNTLFMDKPGKR